MKKLVTIPMDALAAEVAESLGISPELLVVWQRSRAIQLSRIPGGWKLELKREPAISKISCAERGRAQAENWK